ncbi:hypothetical protein SDC9_128344 [bioreactor metagenome]|uniref:DUF4304 domain-containing protein n=1 Tax=bioreactor metagenome TaxID=1076179 RepID=A0A645CX60_9ZZZZ
MDNFTKQYFERCLTEFSQYGFKKHGNAFVRVINDVFQNFYLEKLGTYSYGRECRIGFAVLPLCQKNLDERILNGVGLYYLRGFERSHWSQADRWRYEVNIIDSIIDDIMRYFKQYLIPFFERANSCETAFDALVDLEKHFNETRLMNLSSAGINDARSEVISFDSAKFFMALKNRNYDFALAIKKMLLQQNIDALASVINGGFLTEKALTERETNLEAIRGEIKRLEERDEKYFQDIILEYEAHSKEILKSIINAASKKT